MGKIILFSAILVSLLFTGCTSEEGKLKKQAVEVGEVRLLQLIEKEAYDNMAQSSELRQGYMDFIKARAEVTAEEVQFHGENAATVPVTVSMPPNRLRKTILAIAGKLDPDKARRFSFGEAESLIKKQTNDEAAPEKQSLGAVKFSKQSGGWVQIEN